MYFFGIDVPLIEVVFVLSVFNSIILIVSYFLLKKIKSIEDEMVSMSNKLSKIEETELAMIKELNIAAGKKQPEPIKKALKKENNNKKINNNKKTEKKNKSNIAKPIEKTQNNNNNKNAKNNQDQQKKQQPSKKSNQKETNVEESIPTITEI